MDESAGLFALQIKGPGRSLRWKKRGGTLSSICFRDHRPSLGNESSQFPQPQPAYFQRGVQPFVNSPQRATGVSGFQGDLPSIISTMNKVVTRRRHDTRDSAANLPRLDFPAFLAAWQSPINTRFIVPGLSPLSVVIANRTPGGFCKVIHKFLGLAYLATSPGRSVVTTTAIGFPSTTSGTLAKAAPPRRSETASEKPFRNRRDLEGDHLQQDSRGGWSRFHWGDLSIN